MRNLIIISFLYPLRGLSMDTTLQILEKVDSFYNHSFSTLIWFVGVLLALVGVFVPLAIHLIESRKMRLDREMLE